MSRPASYPPIESLLPHRPPMLLLRRVVHTVDDLLVADLQVDASGPFGDGLGVPAWVGIEYMAQAVAAWAGWRSYQSGGEPRLGFLLGTRSYTAHCARFEHGAVLEVAVRCELMGDNGLGAFQCRVGPADQPLAEARLSVFEPPNAQDFLEQTS